MKRLLLITDAWSPQTNGVVTTLQAVLACLERSGFATRVIHPGDFRTLPLPTYPEIRIARNPWLLKRMVHEFRPDHVHIATEGPLGVYGRRFLARSCIPFTTSLHTKFPEYVHQRLRFPIALGYRFMRWFHEPAVRTLCTTESHRAELEGWGLSDLVVWGRGVEIDAFRPQALTERARPRLLYVGRVAVEKSIQDFLDMAVDADKVVVGDGPQRAELERRYPEVAWLGYRTGQPLVDEYAQADVLVFPSRTDTFGLVMLEANACGTPVAAFPVTGPVDVVREGVNGCLDEDLGAAVRGALAVPRSSCREHALRNTWDAVAKRMADNLAPIDWDAQRRLAAERARAAS